MKKLKCLVVFFAMILASRSMVAMEKWHDPARGERDFMVPISHLFHDHIYYKDMNKNEESFFLAVKNDKVKNVEALLKKGVNINVQDSLGSSALITAINANVPNVVKVLLANNADLKIQNLNKQTAMDLVEKRDDKLLKIIFREITDYLFAVKFAKKEDALVNAITHNGKYDSQFTKEQWIRLALLRNDTKQLFYALNKKVIDSKSILKLIASVPSMPLDFISQLMYEGKVTFNDLKPYYEIAKTEDNKKFGRYYVKLQTMLHDRAKSKKISKDILHKIASFLEAEETEPVEKTEKIEFKKNKKLDQNKKLDFVGKMDDVD